MTEQPASDGCALKRVYERRVFVHALSALDEKTLSLVAVSSAGLRCHSGRLGHHVYLVSDLYELVHQVDHIEVRGNPVASERNAHLPRVDTWRFCHGSNLGAYRTDRGNTNVPV